ncbi:MAG TPA: histidine phosphatase family protein [Terrimesophilobacter sp.]|nr:histidine phosphatase family protein [Terrimesophilobacter sp.]
MTRGEGGGAKVTFLYLVRHGETDWNRTHRVQGTTDIPLNDTGRAQALRAGRLLARRNWDGIYSSPLSRAFETANIIGTELGLTGPLPVPELAERNYGEAEGLTDREIARRYPGTTPVPGRESREAVAARVIPALLTLAEGNPGRQLIVCSHGAVIRTLLMAVEAPIQRGVPITNGSIHSFRHIDGSLELIEFDDPIERASVVEGEEDLDQQNALEEREAKGVS